MPYSFILTFFEELFISNLILTGINIFTRPKILNICTNQKKDRGDLPLSLNKMYLFDLMLSCYNLNVVQLYLSISTLDLPVLLLRLIV